jgi:acetoacetyl-CoA synthetase
VPAVIVEVADLPRTQTGKISEIAVREAVHGREVKGIGALANPESLDAIVAAVPTD